MEQKGSSSLYVVIFQERYVSSFHGSGERKSSSSAVIYIYTPSLTRSLSIVYSNKSVMLYTKTELRDFYFFPLLFNSYLTWQTQYRKILIPKLNINVIIHFAK